MFPRAAIAGLLLLGCQNRGDVEPATTDDSEPPAALAPVAEEDAVEVEPDPSDPPSPAAVPPADPPPAEGPVTVRFHARNNARLSVLVDGRRVGRTPLEVELEPGRYSVTAVDVDGSRHAQVVTVQSGGNRPVLLGGHVPGDYLPGSPFR